MSYLLSKPIMYDLSNHDWDRLIKLGLVDAAGNGFANTTEKFDKNCICTSTQWTLIGIVGLYYYTFAVTYMSGCFYPIWKKLDSSDYHYLITKGGDIECGSRKWSTYK